MAKNLLIVESPAKAKTIEKILGSDYIVKSSFGHIRDLEKDGKNKKAIDIANNYTPIYAVTPDKLRVVKELKEAIKKVDNVWLASDDDREGEAISWHLSEVLNLDNTLKNRIVFREITKPGITKAVQNPRYLDMDLVNAQQARRVLDRLYGFELSELLWKKIKGNLSAGRVQSVTVKLVVERERNIMAFTPTPFFKLQAYFEEKNDKGRAIRFRAEAADKITNATDAETFLNSCIGANYTVKKIEVKPTKRSPSAPFTTSSLQQEASRKLYMSVNKTMQVAQRLYEAGFITYMRTDSTNLSEEALSNIATVVEQNYGIQYVNTRHFKTKNASAQEAHEAIRPTYPEKMVVSEDRDEQRLYELIWKRTMASQMADAQLERTNVTIDISTNNSDLKAVGEVLKFDGFLKLYEESQDDDHSEEDDDKAMLPPMKVEQKLNFQEMIATERFTKASARYTEASLVKALEENGIGRPSTYAPTITKIMDPTRGYVVKENRDGFVRDFNVLTLNSKNEITKQINKEKFGEEKNKLFPTNMGMEVTKFLDSHFDNIMNYGFTADVENKLDLVAEGQENWVKLVDSLYKPFHQMIEQTSETSERVTGERILGKDPKSGRTVLVRLSKFGPVVQIGKTDELAENEKPAYANLKSSQSLENITLDEVLPLFDLPKIVGEYEGHELVVNAGRYGPYVKYKEAFISLPKDCDPFTVTFETALEVVQQKLQADAPFASFQDLPITKGKGRFGPFIKWNEMFINVPKKYNFDTITEAECAELIQAKVEKESTRVILAFEEYDIKIEKDRWGKPYMRMGKKLFTLRNDLGSKMSIEEAETLTFTEVQRIIEEQGGKLKKVKS